MVIILPKVSTDVGELLSLEHHEEKEKNKKMFLKVLEGIRFLARQGLPFRNLVDEDSNFCVLLSLLSVDCPDLKLWMAKKTNKYTSHDIQNECVKLMAFHILRQLSKNIQENGWYAIMADECTDVSNVEQFTICIRWVDKYLESHESFIGLYEVDSITSDTLVSAIKDTLVRLNVKLTDCRGQCYDGASNMSGSRRGVAAQICGDEKKALYTHCYGHALNLAVSDTIKQSKVCCDALDTAYEITRLVKFSPKRDAAFERIRAELQRMDENPINISHATLKKFCPTRWTVRGAPVTSILNNYSALIELW